MNKYSGVYLIESKSIPSKQYVGSSIDVLNRFKEHKRSLKGGYHNNIKLSNHVGKYGLKDLKFKVLQYCDVNNLIDVEQFYYDLLKPSFCLREPVKSNYGSTQSDEVKRKKSKALKSFWDNQSDEYKREHAERTKQLRRDLFKKPKGFNLYHIERTDDTDNDNTFLLKWTCKLCNETFIKSYGKRKTMRNQCCIKEKKRKDINNYTYISEEVKKATRAIPDYSHNSKMRKDNTSGYKGVTYDKASKMFRARIKYKGKLYDAGRAHSPKTCALLRNNYILEKGWPHQLSVID